MILLHKELNGKRTATQRSLISGRKAGNKKLKTILFNLIKFLLLYPLEKIITITLNPAIDKSTTAPFIAPE